MFGSSLMMTFFFVKVPSLSFFVAAISNKFPKSYGTYRFAFILNLLPSIIPFIQISIGFLILVVIIIFLTVIFQETCGMYIQNIYVIFSADKDFLIPVSFLKKQLVPN